MILSRGDASLSHIMMWGLCMLLVASVTVRRRRRSLVSSERVGGVPSMRPASFTHLRQLARRHSSGLTRATAGRGGDADGGGPSMQHHTHTHLSHHHHSCSYHTHLPILIMFAPRLLPRLASSSVRSPLASTSSSLLASRRGFASSRPSLASSLLYLEHREGELNAASLVALTAAKKIGGDIHAIVAGDEGIKEVADKASK